MVTGGSPHVADTWIQNFGTLAVEKGPSMAQKRMFHACGKFQIKGKTILMVVGGRESFDPKIFTKTSEYINLDKDATWKQGIKNKKKFHFFFFFLFYLFFQIFRGFFITFYNFLVFVSVSLKFFPHFFFFEFFYEK